LQGVSPVPQGLSIDPFSLGGAVWPAVALQPFAALYVLTLASLAPLLAKESERIHHLFTRLLSRAGKGEAAEEEATRGQA
jgi:hypothetical protein